MIKIEPINRKQVIEHKINSLDSRFIEMFNEIILEKCEIYSCAAINKKYLKEKCLKYSLNIEDVFNQMQIIRFIYGRQQICLNFYCEEMKIIISLMSDK